MIRQRACQIIVTLQLVIDTGCIAKKDGVNSSIDCAPLE